MGLFSHLLFPFPAQHITEGQRATLPPKLQPKPVELSETPCLALFSEEDNGWGIRLCGKFQVAAAVKNPTPPLGRLWVTSTHKTIVILCLCVCCSSLIFVHTEREVHTRPDLFSALPSAQIMRKTTVQRSLSCATLGLRKSLLVEWDCWCFQAFMTSLTEQSGSSKHTFNNKT